MARLKTPLDYLDCLRNAKDSEVSFFVIGIPIEQGSKNAMVTKKKGASGEGRSAYRAVMFEQNPNLKGWRTAVKNAAQRAIPKDWDTNAMYFYNCVYFFPRPGYHFAPDQSVKPKYLKEKCKSTSPDRDKLDRAIGDALHEVCYDNDAKIVAGFSLKLWAEPDLPGALVSIVKICNKINFSLDPR